MIDAVTVLLHITPGAPEMPPGVGPPVPSLNGRLARPSGVIRFHYRPESVSSGSERIATYPPFDGSGKLTAASPSSCTSRIAR